jgi:T5SS/PEP-CTERM-associated repeat protein
MAMPAAVLGDSFVLSNQTIKTVTDDWYTATNLYVGETDSGNTLIITNGARVICNPYIRLGNDDGANSNRVVISGHNSLLHSAGSYTGDGGSYNNLRVEKGGRFRTPAYYSVAGQDNGSRFNKISVTGTNSIWTASYLTIGSSGSDNLLEITNGGEVDVGSSLVIGRNSTASRNCVAVNGEDSRLIIQRAIYLGCTYDRDTETDDSGGPDNTLSVQNAGWALCNGAIYNHCESFIQIGTKAKLTAGKTYSQSDNSSLEIICATAATNSGKLSVVGDINLAGSLIIRPAPAFSPGTNYTVQLIETQGQIKGQFDTLNLPSLPPQNMWDTSALYTDGILRLVGPPLPPGTVLTDSVSIEANGCQRFCTKDNRELWLKPIDYIESQDVLVCELPDGTPQEIPMSELKDEEQESICDWDAANDLLEGKLKIEVEETEGGALHYQGNLEDWAPGLSKLQYSRLWSTAEDSVSTYFNIWYDLLLENRANRPIEDIQVDYCIYQQIEIKENRERIVTNVTTGTFTVDRLSEDERRTLRTELVKIIEDATEQKTSTRANAKPGDLGSRSIEAKPLGIRYRIRIPTPSGAQLVEKEYADPDRLLQTTKWVSPR